MISYIHFSLFLFLTQQLLLTSFSTEFSSETFHFACGCIVKNTTKNEKKNEVKKSEFIWKMSLKSFIISPLLFYEKWKISNFSLFSFERFIESKQLSLDSTCNEEQFIPENIKKTP
jgi:hypothetical protein